MADVNELESARVADFLTASGCSHHIAFWRTRDGLEDEGRAGGPKAGTDGSSAPSEKRPRMSDA